MEKIRLKEILTLIKERLTKSLEALNNGQGLKYHDMCICDSLRTCEYQEDISYDEHFFLRTYFQNKFDENNLAYYNIHDLSICDSDILSFRFYDCNCSYSRFRIKLCCCLPLYG